MYRFLDFQFKFGRSPHSLVYPSLAQLIRVASISLLGVSKHFMFRNVLTIVYFSESLSGVPGFWKI